MERHFTVTGFVVREGRTLLLWHRKNRLWLPPGGHVDPGEEPEGAVLREIEEETGLTARIVPTGPSYAFDSPPQVARPAAILLEDIDEPGRFHQHIDLIYFCAPEGPADAPVTDHTARWLDRDQLAADEPLEYAPGESAPVPDDVRVLGAHAIDSVTRYTGTGADPGPPVGARL